MSDFGVRDRLTARLDAVQELTHMVVGRIAAAEFPLLEKRNRKGFDLARVAGFHPTLVAFEADGAGAEPQTLADFQLHAVGVGGRDVAFRIDYLVVDRASVVGVVCPLADIDRVAAPLGD